MPQVVLDRAAPPRAGSLFGSLFLGGFECANHLLPDGHRLDVIAATQHDRLAAEDYARCRSVGIRAVREAARWPIADRRGRLDLSQVHRLARLSRENDLTVIWDLFHYGYPDDLDARADDFGDRFLDRFTTFADAVARAVRAETHGATWWTPVNEISYTAWAAGDAGLMAPAWHGRGWEYKLLLVRAWIAAFEAIRSIDPDARMLTAEPLVRLHVHPEVTEPAERARLQAEADDFNSRVVPEAYDMLAGRVEPALGGSRDHLGIVGVNYYEGNQWTIPTPTLPQHFLGRSEPSWLPLSDILVELEDRYGGPIVISETGSTAEARPGWIEHITAEVSNAIERGVDVQGICLYPIVTSPDWNDPTAFFEGGLWDVTPGADGLLRRTVVPDVAAALHAAQLRLDPGSARAAPEIRLVAAEPEPDVVLAKADELARFSPDGFVCVTLVAGEEMVADLYCLEPGKSVAGHRHPATEHLLTAIRGSMDVRIGSTWLTLQPGECVLIPRGIYHGIHNATADRLMVQQVTSPKPWDARFGGPRPSDVGLEREK